jgi:hypothetical protein
MTTEAARLEIEGAEAWRLDLEDENSRKRSTLPALRLLTRPSPIRGVFGSAQSNFSSREVSQQPRR